MDPDVRGDMISLDCSGTARVPVTSEAKIVGALAANMSVAYMLLSTKC